MGKMGSGQRPPRRQTRVPRRGAPRTPRPYLALLEPFLPSTAVILRTYLRIGSGAGERRQTFLICGLSTRRPVPLRIRLVMETLRARSHIPRTRSHILRTRTRARNAAAHLPTAPSRTIRDVAASLGIASRRRARPADGVILHYYVMMFTCSLTTYLNTLEHRARGVRARASPRSTNVPHAVH